MIVNIRGASGSGKSTLVRAIMSYYKVKIPRTIEGRKHPMGYTLRRDDGEPLYVPGHYETPCGGCDNLSHNEAVIRIMTAQNMGLDILFEGSKLFGKTAEFQRLHKAVPEMIAISLTTPYEVCCDNLRKRRKSGMVDEAKIQAESSAVADEAIALEKSGVDVRTLLYEDALDAIKQLFKL